MIFFFRKLATEGLPIILNWFCFIGEILLHLGFYINFSFWKMSLLLSCRAIISKFELQLTCWIFAYLSDFILFLNGLLILSSIDVRYTLPARAQVWLPILIVWILWSKYLRDGRRCLFLVEWLIVLYELATINPTLIDKARRCRRPNVIFIYLLVHQIQRMARINFIFEKWFWLRTLKFLLVFLLLSIISGFFVQAKLRDNWKLTHLRNATAFLICRFLFFLWRYWPERVFSLLIHWCKWLNRRQILVWMVIR